VENLESKEILLRRVTEVAFDGTRRRPGDALCYRLLAGSEMMRYELVGENRLENAKRALDVAARLYPTLLWIEEDRSRLEKLMRRRG
jgi:hypothetical protein